jgi:ubiquinone/menaquinone biosynthesis C-methylase UbiE
LSLKHSYTLVAPFYDAFLTAATRGARKRSLAALVDEPPRDVLLMGVGTGLDLPHLPAQHRYVGLDLTAAMLARARPRPACTSRPCAATRSACRFMMPASMWRCCI